MSGPVIGGPIRVDTSEMLRASSVLADADAALEGLLRRTRSAELAAPPDRRAALQQAGDSIALAGRQAEAARHGLVTAAERYRWTEQLVAGEQQTLFASAGAMEGWFVRVLGLPGLTAVATADVGVSAVFLGSRALDELWRTGRVDLQSDPVVVRWLQLRISSLDDTIRGFLGVETARDLVVDDPASPFGTEEIAAAISAVLWPGVRRPLEVRRTVAEPVARPASIAALAARLPDGAKPEGQVRIERYDDADGPRWIVYSAGTVTFDRDSGSEPFDLESDIRGVADQRTDAEQAVVTAMREAGVRPDEPVLFVGHSQGALNVLRIAQQHSFDVVGAVTFGGPTEEIAAPSGTDVLQVVHTQDIVPALGGVAAAASAGTVTVRRQLPQSALTPGTSGTAIDCFPAHDMRNYRSTIRQAEALDDPQVETLRSQWSGFFSGRDGEATRYRAWRPGSPPPVSAPAQCH